MTRLPAALAVVLVLTAGCGGDDATPPAPSATESSPAMPTAPAEAATPPPSGTATHPAPTGDPAPPQVPLPDALGLKYSALGGPTGYLGPLTGPVRGLESGATVADFTGGTIIDDGHGRAFVVQGGILDRYRAEGGPEGRLGLPVSDETTTDGGWISVFAHGTITVLGGVATVTYR